MKETLNRLYILILLNCLQAKVLAEMTDIVFTAKTSIGDGPDVGVLKENNIAKRISYYRKGSKDMDFMVRVTAEQYNGTRNLLRVFL